MTIEPSEFTWDDDKAVANEMKHGVSFRGAIKVFLDARRVDRPDERRIYGEERRNVTGLVAGICITLSYTMRGTSARIISARRASRKERRLYGTRG